MMAKEEVGGSGSLVQAAGSLEEAVGGEVVALANDLADLGYLKLLEIWVYRGFL